MAKFSDAVEAATRLAEIFGRQAREYARDPLVIYMAHLIAARTEIFRFEQVISAEHLAEFRADAARVEKFVAEEMSLVKIDINPGDDPLRIVSIPLGEPGSQGPVS
jgi:hypothetical protein